MDICANIDVHIDIYIYTHIYIQLTLPASRRCGIAASV